MGWRRSWSGGGTLCNVEPRGRRGMRRPARQVPKPCSLKKMRSTWREKVPLSSIPQTKQNTSETDYDYIGIGLSWSAHPCKHRSRMGSRRLEHPTGGGSDVLANVAPPPRTRGTGPAVDRPLTHAVRTQEPYEPTRKIWFNHAHHLTRIADHTIRKSP